jgi:chaperonin GroES
MAKKKINIRPLADRVLVKRLEEEDEQMVGGIIIPDTAKEKPQEAEVIAVGPGSLNEGKRVPLEVKAGDKVLIGKYSGTEVKIEGEEYLIIREDELLAVVE